MNLAKRQLEAAEAALAEALGRPERRCPECGEVGAHWVPETLDEAGSLVAGFFSCAPVVGPSVGVSLFELEGGA